MLDARALHRRAVRALPQAVQTAGVWQAPTDPAALSALLFPLRRKPAGSLLLQLSAATCLALAQDPLRYLRQATAARQGLGRRQEPCRYRPWRSAWIPASMLSLPAHSVEGSERHPDPARPWLACFTARTDGRALLLVLPEAGLALYAWNDRAAAPAPEQAQQQEQEQEFLRCWSGVLQAGPECGRPSAGY
ncbi:MAG: hypothetical protein EOP91_07200 [Lysobacteraceae bacterium]|nr:MAG: hypothetical protein EOP91_07200 [Xanthomonadaceae bacterium]